MRNAIERIQLERRLALALAAALLLCAAAMFGLGRAVSGERAVPAVAPVEQAAP